MYICTYKLPGKRKDFSREKTLIPAAHKMFIKDYAEAAGQVRKVKIEKTTDPGFFYGKLATLLTEMYLSC